MSMGKTANNGTVSVLTKTSVTVYKKEDVLINMQGQAHPHQGARRMRPILNTVMEQRGQWQPRRLFKQARKTLRHANSIYNLPSTEQAIKWMHTICGYLVKSMWLKAIKAGNYVGWLMLTERNIQKYYPEATKTAKGHLKKKRMLHQRTTCPIRNMQHLSTPWQESTQCIHQSVQGTQNNVLQPNRPVPYTLATRQQIHHGDGQNQQQCHPC